jgi:hypothetical protein
MIAIVSAAQMLMNRYLDDKLHVDGVLGPETTAAVAGAPFECCVIFEDMGIPSNYLRYEEIDMTSRARKPTRAEAARIARAFYRVSRDMNVPSHWLMSFARIESGFDMNAVNGRHKGLFQFRESTWEYVSKNVALRDFDRYWNDPYENAKAAAAYMKANIENLARHGIDARNDPRLLYLAHQQGARGLRELVSMSQGGRDNGVITPVKMRSNKPPGYDVTLNPVKFYHNWMSYLGRIFK